MNAVNKMNAWLRGLVVVAASVLLLAACGNPVKSDLIAIANVMRDTGYTPEKNAEYQQRLQSAKNEAEAKVIVNEMMAIFEQVPKGLDALSLKSDEGKLIRDDLSQGMAQILTATQKSMTLSPKDTAAMLETQKAMIAGQQRLMKGQNAFMVAAGREGLDKNK